MALAIDGVALHPVRMPLSRTVRWASSSEAHADYMILELRADQGEAWVDRETLRLVRLP